MSGTYDNVSAADIAIGPSQSVEARRKRLFDDFTMRMFKRKIEAGQKEFSDRQTRAWLGWLARGMQRHNLVTFFIEQLQPSWLPSVTWQTIYIFVSRIVVCVFGGLVGGVCVALGTGEGFSRAIQRGCIEGAVGGFISSLTLGLLEMVWPRAIRSPFIAALTPFKQSILKIAVTSIVVALSVALVSARLFSTIGFLTHDATWWFSEGVMVGLWFGCCAGLLFAFGTRGTRKGLTDDIQAVEQLGWKTQGAVFGGAIGIVIGVIVGGIVGWLEEITGGLLPIFRTQNDPVLRLILASVTFAAFAGLIGAMFGGLNGVLMTSKKVSPNAGFRLSLRNALQLALMIGPLFSVTAFVLSQIMLRPPIEISLIYGFYALVAGVLAALYYGGLFMIQHTTLRVLLRLNQLTPALGEYGAFLDYAAQRIFLHKVGGGYRFVHRYLQEYFAAAEAGSNQA